MHHGVLELVQEVLVQPFAQVFHCVLGRHGQGARVVLGLQIVDPHSRLGASRNNLRISAEPDQPHGQDCLNLVGFCWALRRVLVVCKI